VTVGNKAHQAFRRTGSVTAAYKDIMGTFQMFNAREISQGISESFINGEVDQVDLVYGKFHSVAVQKPAVELLLPIKPMEAEEEGEGAENKNELT